MSVHLRQASVKLMRSKTNCSEGQLLFDFEFQNVKVEHESRPSRTGSYMFSLRLGAIYLRDKITTNSLFPLLISHQSSEDAPLYPRSSQNRFSGFAKSILSFLPSSLGPGKEEEALDMDPVVSSKGKWFLFVEKVKERFLFLFTWPKAGWKEAQEGLGKP